MKKKAKKQSNIRKHKLRYKRIHYYMMPITCKVIRFVKYCQVFGEFKVMLLGISNFHGCEIICKITKAKILDVII